MVGNGARSTPVLLGRRWCGVPHVEARNGKRIDSRKQELRARREGGDAMRYVAAGLGRDGPGQHGRAPERARHKGTPTKPNRKQKQAELTLVIS